MRLHSRSALLGASVLLGGALCGSGVAAAQTPGAEAGSLAQIRQATAQYHSVERAIADGFVSTVHCEESEEGAMGIHFVRVDRVLDPSVNPVEPEVLLYEPDENGKLRLVGVEYVVLDEDQDVGTPNADPPSLLGVPFDGPMPGHHPGEPVHYDLHVWVWQHNPEGMYEPWNPSVQCPPAET